ncbi:glycosyl transferase [Neosynechococcus sphagnicola sy1]|uniref:Glycosyl transferase n=2 Tax=Neosynechococcus TaxID=1501143 RepID=A0A098TMR4_9CYAN|nr:glycosyl transferase [Neosynechococcus sphagnicola sy1]
MLMVLQVLLLLLIVASLGFYIVCTVSTLWFFVLRQRPDSTDPQPVSILIPVCGVDEGALANWTSFCIQDIPTYEVLFGVMNPEDPAVPILKTLIAQFPDHARLILCQEVRGINHQISNLMHLLEAAQFERIIFADSDIRVTPEYLRIVTAPLADPAIGVVTCGYLDHAPKFLGAAIAALGRGVDFIPSVLIARSLDGGLKFALGPTVATRQSVVANMGGLQMVVNRIGSDFHMGRLAVAAGYRVELSTYILENDCGRETLNQVFQRELRWARTIRWNRGAQYYGLVFSYGTVHSLLLVLVTGFQPWAIALFAAVWLVRLLQVTLAIYHLGCPHLLPWLWALPLRDWMSFVIWVAGSYGQQIYWRGRWLEVGASGTLQEKIKASN